MTFIVQSYFYTLLCYVESLTFCGEAVLKVMDQDEADEVRKSLFRNNLPDSLSLSLGE